jgi:tripartite ATP-independent transporter DctM subunit
MEPWMVTVILFSGIIILLLTGLPVSFSLGFVGMAGLYFLWGGVESWVILANGAFSNISSFILVAVPLFVLMGEIVFFTGLSDRIYRGLETWLGKLPGGLAVTAVAASAMFGATTGFSVTTTATLGSVATSGMLDRGYDKGLATGSVMGGAALGILIPPSTLLILFGSLSGVSVAKLLIGGIMPGLMLAVLFALYIVIRCVIKPGYGPVSDEPITWRDRFDGIKAVFPLLVIIFVVLGVIWFGIASPSEGAAIGVLGCLLLAFVYRRLSWTNLRKALLATARVNGMILFILIAVGVFSEVLAYSGATRQIAEFASSIPISRWLVLILMQIVITMLGCFMDPGSIMFITMPVFLPIVDALGFDRLWFGILCMMNLELGTLTPPFGLNCFVMKSVVQERLSLMEIFSGAIPFALLHALGMVFVMIWPPIAVWLPSLI